LRKHDLKVENVTCLSTSRFYPTSAIVIYTVKLCNSAMLHGKVNKPYGYQYLHAKIYILAYDRLMVCYRPKFHFAKYVRLTVCPFVTCQNFTEIWQVCWFNGLFVCLDVMSSI